MKKWEWIVSICSFVLLVLFILMRMTASEHKAQASEPAPEIVCWIDRLVMLGNYHAFVNDPIEEQRRYNVVSDSSEYGIIQVEYHVRGGGQVLRGPRFFAYDVLQFWDRTYSKYPRCPERHGE